MQQLYEAVHTLISLSPSSTTW